jgi:uncharacterized protein (TIGR02594 family)
MGLLVMASSVAGITQASANVHTAHTVGKETHISRQQPAERSAAVKPAKHHFIVRSEQHADARERERTRERRTVDPEDRPTKLPGRPLTVHNDGDDPGIDLLTDDSLGTHIVAEARRWIGTNPTTRATLWCARFMNFVLDRVGLPGTASDWAKSFATYGKPLEHPEVGAIAVMDRKGGGHVGVVSGFDKDGDPIIISGNHSRRVAESVYSRSRIIAYVSPDIERMSAN